MALLPSIIPALFLTLVPSAAAPADKPLAVPLEEDPFRGTLVSVDSKGLMVFETEGGKKELPAGTLVRWGECVDPDRAPVFLLRDGTLLVAGILEAGPADLSLDSDSVGLVRLPRQEIAAVVIRLPASRLDRDRLLDEAVRNEAETTQVVMLNGDRMRGELTALSDRDVSLRTSVGPVQLDLENISTLTFPRSTTGVPANPSVVGLADGSRVCVKQLTIDGDTGNLETAGGLSWKAAAKKIAYLQPASPRVVYLSDLTPAGYRHVPYLDRTWEYQKDRNALGGLMRSGGRLHLKGLGMYTAARISYAPPKNSVGLQAELCIDDGTEGLGSVRFRVFVDGNEKYVSPTVRGFDPPVPLAVDVRGAERIDLVVDFADAADVQDQANWLEARFVLGE